jgi:hypothetical protein
MATCPGPTFFETRMPTSCRVYKNLLMGVWLILCIHEQAFQGPPRTRQGIAACQSLMAKKSFWGPQNATCSGVRLVTLKTLRASPWCKRASAKPMGSPGRSSAEALSWMMLSLIALTRQKQLAKSRQATSQPAPNARHVSSKTAFSCRNSRSIKPSQFFLLRTRNETARNNSRKWNFVLSDVYTRHRKHAFNGCFEKRVQMDNFANRLKCDWTRNPS